MVRKVMVIGTGLAGLLFFFMGFRPAYGTEIEKGRELYMSKGCPMCHGRDLKGTRMGPGLLGVGNQRDAEWLMRFLVDPKGTLPGARMFPVKASKKELAALVEYMRSLKK